jgi:hypothetical protein
MPLVESSAEPVFPDAWAPPGLLAGTTSARKRDDRGGSVTSLPSRYGRASSANLRTIRELWEGA